VCSLDVEGLFDFCVRGDEEMEDDEGRDEEVERNVWIIMLARACKYAPAISSHQLASS
jgi:hypothetical protein